MAEGVEHRVGKDKRATPEKNLNSFVRFVAFIERVGNALGTLAFTWATVVLLGSYPTVLRQKGVRDFWCATIIVFLEAAKMFSRNNKMDYQLFFHTKGAFRRLGWNGLIVIVCLSNITTYWIALIKDRDRGTTHQGTAPRHINMQPLGCNPIDGSLNNRVHHKTQWSSG
ncbi:hypothetical protein EJB05_10818, partial [Eragrostis curvula]